MKKGIRSLKPQSIPAQTWLQTARGRWLLQQERRQVKAIMPSVLGYRMLQIGRWGFSSDAAGGSAILRHWILDTERDEGVSAQVDPGNLPVASRSVDAVLLPHSLELTDHPHRLLREADRVLCDRGQIIILGFNPYAPAVLMRYLPGNHPWYPELHRLYSLGRASDWLGLLDYEIEKTEFFGRSIPWGGHRAKLAEQNEPGLALTMQKLIKNLSLGYMIFARKRVIPLTPARRRWQARPQLGPMALPEARVSRVRYLHNVRKPSET